MAKGAYRIQKTATLPASGPGEFAEVEISGTGIVAADNVQVSIQGTTRPVTSTGDSFGIYIESISTGKVVVKANKMQTPAVTVSMYVAASA